MMAIKRVRGRSDDVKVTRYSYSTGNIGIEGPTMYLYLSFTVQSQLYSSWIYSSERCRKTVSSGTSPAMLMSQ